jgi:hypothetical protein
MHRALYPICGQDAPKFAQRGEPSELGRDGNRRRPVLSAPQLLFAPQLFSIFGLYDLAAHQLTLYGVGFRERQTMPHKRARYAIGASSLFVENFYLT